MKRRIKLPKEILNRLNEHIESCLKHEDRTDQNNEFMSFVHDFIKPIKMTATTAVFLHDTNEKFIIKRVIYREESPTQEDVISTAVKNKYIMSTFYSFREVCYYKDWDDFGEEMVTKERVVIWLLAEYLPIKISQRDVNKNEDKIRKIASDVLKGLIFLHERNIAHLDIKIANIMGTYSGGEVIYKLIDLGYARDLEKEAGGINGEIYIPKKSFGTFPYKPPEIVRENIHGLKSDIYCLGAVVWFLSIGYTSFYENGEKNVDLFKKFVAGKVKLKFKEGTSELLKDFVIQAMNRDRHKRIGAKELLNHDFLRKRDLKNL